MKKNKLVIKNKSKFIIAIVSCIFLIILVLAIILVINLSNKKSKSNETDFITSTEDFVLLSSDGTKTNISAELKKTKNISGLDFSDISIVMQNNQTVITGKVTNPTSDTIKGFYFKIQALNSSSDIIGEMDGLLDSVIPAGETITFKSAATNDFANCYDIKIIKISDVD